MNRRELLTGAAAIVATAASARVGATTMQPKPQQMVSVTDFGADPTGVSDSTAAIQNAVNATSIGGTLTFPSGTYKLSAAIRITTPITVQGSGPGSFVNDLGSRVIQSNTSANAFTLVATHANYAFGAYGIIDVHFKDIAITGPSSNNYAIAGVGVDVTINKGDFHIRECTFWNVNMRYFTSGVAFTGIAYLNNWHGGCYSYCSTGVSIARGTSSDAGGQTRFFGTTFDMNGHCGLSFLEDAMSGDLSCFGCTFADTQYGLRVNQRTTLVVEGCHFESCKNSGTGAGIYLPITDNSNPNTSAPKLINGNNFNDCDQDIWINKTSKAFSSGAFGFPIRIDCNNFGDANAIVVSVPSGHSPLDSTNAVIGASNCGPRGYGSLSESQISANCKIIREANRRVTRRYPFDGTYVSGNPLDSLPIGMIVVSVRMYLTKNSASFTSLMVGDAANNSRYISGINGNTQTLNTWINGTITVPEAPLNATNFKLILIGTAGVLGAAGVIEIDGYIP